MSEYRLTAEQKRDAIARAQNLREKLTSRARTDSDPLGFRAPEPARPVGGDTREALREELGDVFLRHWRTVTSGCECGEMRLGQSYPLHLADAVLTLPAVRAALAAQETLRRVEAVLRVWSASGVNTHGWLLGDLRRALDGGS